MLRHEKGGDEVGLTNVEIMVPFLRTVSEGQQVLDLLAANRLKRGDNGLKMVMMCERSVERYSGRPVAGTLRRLFRWFQRHDPDDTCA